jgi:hypothetical protein
VGIAFEAQFADLLIVMKRRRACAFVVEHDSDDPIASILEYQDAHFTFLGEGVSSLSDTRMR